jgi:hypothetical protein
LKLSHLIVSFLALLVAPALASACGGDDDSSEPGELQTYFQELSAVAALASVQLTTLEERFPGVFEEVEPTRQYATEYVTIYDRFVESARDLAPPEEVADEHAAYVTASEELQGLAQSRLEELQGAETKEEIDAVYAADDAFAEAVAKQDFACSELKRIADDQGIPVPGLQDCKSFN